MDKHKHFVLGGVKRMEEEDDPQNNIKKMMTRKLTDSVHKVKNILRWSFSKNNFLYGFPTDKDITHNNSEDFDPNSKELKSIKEVTSKNTKVKLFKKGILNAKRRQSTFAKR